MHGTNMAHQFSSVTRSCLTLCDLWNAACLSLSIINSRSMLKLISIESVIPSNHLILCHSLFFLPSIFPSVRVFSNELALGIRCPKNWSFSFSISPFNEYSELIPLGLTGLISLQSQVLSSLLQHETICVRQLALSLAHNLQRINISYCYFY